MRGPAPGTMSLPALRRFAALRSTAVGIPLSIDIRTLRRAPASGAPSSLDRRLFGYPTSRDCRRPGPTVTYIIPVRRKRVPTRARGMFTGSVRLPAVEHLWSLQLYLSRARLLACLPACLAIPDTHRGRPDDQPHSSLLLLFGCDSRHTNAQLPLITWTADCF